MAIHTYPLSFIVERLSYSQRAPPPDRLAQGARGGALRRIPQHAAFSGRRFLREIRQYHHFSLHGASSTKFDRRASSSLLAPWPGKRF
jgi:hypothetical protein